MKKRIFLRLCVLGFLVLALTGCNKQKGDMRDTDAQEGNAGIHSISLAQDTSAKELIRNFYTQMFLIPMDEAKRNNQFKAVSEAISPMLSSDVLNEKVGTVGFPIHYPRFLEINGLILYDYELIQKDEEPKMEIKFYEKKQGGTGYAFLVEAYLKAYVVQKEKFNSTFGQTLQNIEQTSMDLLPEDQKDFIRIKAKYDVLVNFTDGDPKIEMAMEASANPYFMNATWASQLLNNDFVERLPFHELETLEDNEAYQNEVALVTEFMDALFSKLDRTTSQILAFDWDIGALEFKSLLERYNLLNRENGEEFFSNLFETDAYKTKFSKEAFPMKAGMERMSQWDFDIKQNPGYRNRYRIYRVKVNALVETSSGNLTGDSSYTYEYLIALDQKDNRIYVDSVSLNTFVKN
jgi:hypothetical protein